MKNLAVLLLILITSNTTTVLAADGASTQRPAWQRVMKPLQHQKTMPPAVIVAPVAASVAANTVPDKPKVPVIKFLGSLQRGNERFIFAEVNGKVYSVRSGDEMAGIYHLVALGEHEARFVYLPTNENYLVYMD